MLRTNATINNGPYLRIYKHVRNELDSLINNKDSDKTALSTDDILKNMLLANNHKLNENTSYIRYIFHDLNIVVYFVYNAQVSKDFELIQSVADLIDFEGYKNIIIFMDYFKDVKKDPAMGYTKYVDYLKSIFSLFISLLKPNNIEKYTYTHAGKLYSMLDIILSAYIVKEFWELDKDDLLVDDSFIYMINNTSVIKALSGIVLYK